MYMFMKNISRYLSLMTILMAVLTVMAPAPATADTYWTLQPENGAGSWFDDENWNEGIPTITTYAFISNGGTANITSGGAAAQSLTIAYYPSSTGTVTQNGGTLTNNVLMMGLTANANGFYNLLGGSLYTQQVCVGGSGYGEFSQGTNTEHQVAQQLTIGQSTGGVGKYTLDGGTLQTSVTMVGYEGTGTFDHKAGTHSAGAVNVGHNTTSGQGTYNLDGGNLVSQGLSINGEFKQTSGTNTNAGWLMLSANPGGVATYSLVDGTLETGNEHIGGEGTSTFTQTGGEHRVTNSTPGQGLRLAGGSFNLGDGDLETAQVGISNGIFTQTGGTHKVSIELIMNNLSGGQAKYTLEGGSLDTQRVIVGREGFGEFFQKAGSTHTLALGMGIGQSPSGVGQYTLAGGNLSLASLANLTLGSQGTGTFTQTGGEVAWGPSISTNFNTLTLGQNGGTGFYNLQGDTSTLRMDGVEFVGGYQGTGTFIQTGGTNSIKMSVFPGSLDGGRLLIGNQGESQGRYELSGGLLSVDGNIQLAGGGGQGTFIQTGGTINITKTYTEADGGRLNIGNATNSQGSYELSGGQLNVDGKEILGLNGGTGTFIQSGGTNTITMKSGGDGYGRLVVGWYDNSVGTYTLNSGQFTADRIVLGDTDIGTPDQPLASGKGTLTINGGHLEVKQLYVGLAADTHQPTVGFGWLDLASQNAYVEVSESFEIGPIGKFTAVEGATIHMTGTKFIVSSDNQANLADLAKLKLIFTGGPDEDDTFELGFEVGSLEIGPNSRLQFVDYFDNNGDDMGNEGLILESLILNPGAVLYFGVPEEVVIEVDTLFLQDGAVLDPNLDQYIKYERVTTVTTPIPGSLLLLGTGLLGLGALGWRRRKI